MMESQVQTYICPECETKIVELYEEGDCSYQNNLLLDSKGLDYAMQELGTHHDYRNVGYTWHCTDKSCNAGSEGWFGDRTECPPTEREFKEMSETDSSQSLLASLEFASYQMSLARSLFDERLERLEEE